MRLTAMKLKKQNKDGKSGQRKRRGALSRFVVKAHMVPLKMNEYSIYSLDKVSASWQLNPARPREIVDETNTMPSVALNF